MIRYLLAPLLLLLLAAGCSPSQRTGSNPFDDELPPMPPLPPEDEDDVGDVASAGGEQPAAAQPAAGTPSSPPAAAGPAPQEGRSSAAPELPPLPESVEAGEIPRSTLIAVLADGIGHFLRRVRTEPHLKEGRFVGWRLLALPAEDAVLRTGDTVLRVNGQSIERPEQFKNVWDSMSTSSELVLTVRRAGKDSKVRYKIVD